MTCPCCEREATLGLWRVTVVTHMGRKVATHPVMCTKCVRRLPFANDEITKVAVDSRVNT